MKNYIGYLITSKIKLNIKGKNIERFIKRLKNNNIDILKINIINNNEFNIKIYYKDYNKLLDLKTIYEVEPLNYYGMLNIKNKLIKNKFIIISVLICSIFIYILSNMIFNVEILTNDYNMSQTLINELNNFGIGKYKFKKDYFELQEIKQKIINKYRNNIEWLEIESIGTKYIVKYEPRIVNEENTNTEYRHIIAKKDAVITSMEISSGQIKKEINSYVKKGDIIVSGYIYLNQNIKDTVSSAGNVFGETWYEVTVTYPFNYYENIETGNVNKVLVINFLNKKIELFNFNDYENKNIKENIILKNNMLPINISLQEQRETNIIDEKNTKEEALEKAIEKAKKQIEKNLNNDEYIKDYKIINEYSNDSSVTIKIFFSVVENITDYQIIEKYEEKLEE